MSVKKIIALIVISIFVIDFSFASGFSLKVGLGVPAEVGCSYTVGSFEFGAKANSSYGLGGLLTYSLMDKFMDTGLSGIEKFEYGNHFIHGLTVDTYVKAVNKGIFSLDLGTSISALHLSSEEGVISHFTKANLVLFNLNSKFDFQLGEKNSVYLTAGFPLFAYINYGGDESSSNYMPFDFWAFVPTAIKEVEDGGWLGISAGKLALVFLALNLRIGYSFQF